MSARSSKLGMTSLVGGLAPERAAFHTTSSNDSEESKDSSGRIMAKVSQDVADKYAHEYPDEQNVAQWYNEVDHEAYDKYMASVKAVDPYMVVEAISRPEPEQEVNPETGERDFGFLNTKRDAKIFDIGQGTGILGKLLQAEGFTNIYGGDASESFVNKANETGWYKKCHLMWFAQGVENLPKELLGQHDIVMATNVFAKGHIPAAGFDDAYALCKPGGYFVTSLRRYFLERGEHDVGYREKLEQLQADGKFKILRTWEFERGVQGSESPHFLPMPNTMFVAKKLK